MAFRDEGGGGCRAFETPTPQALIFSSRYHGSNERYSNFFEIFFKKNQKCFVSSEKTFTFAVANEKSLLFIAKVAQLVEHDLAKVGVAGPSPVFRSPFFVQVAELVDALL